jgi:hypothetical protein
VLLELFQTDGLVVDPTTLKLPLALPVVRIPGRPVSVAEPEWPGT